MIKTIFKTKFQASPASKEEGYLYYQIICNRTVWKIKTDYKVLAAEWDKHSETLVLNPSHTDPQRLNWLQLLQKRLENDRKRLLQILSELPERKSGITAAEVSAIYQQRLQRLSLSNFMLSVIQQLKAADKTRTSEVYSITLKSFMQFRQNQDILLDEITPEVIMRYEAYLNRKGSSRNTISFYMRTLRAVYNRAVAQKLVTQCFPFKKVYTGMEKTFKRAVPIKAIRLIKGLDLSRKPSLQLARDLFLFSFYTRGMSFVDMAYLKKKDLQHGLLVYNRRKTGQRLFIRWEKPMQEIIDRYDTAESEYLLPIITRKGNERKQYENALRTTNRQLKKIAALARLPATLTMYVARHSWASIAKNKNIPLSVISESMGHNSENTTKIYLTSLSQDTIDNANKTILKDL